MSMPTWLQRHLLDTGAVDEQGRGRAARPRHCRRCGLVVLIGYDGDVAALLCTVDYLPLNTLGEAAAQLAGRYTCNLTSWNRLELTSRYAWQILSRPAGTQRFTDVLAEHRCGWPLPPPEQRAPSGLDRLAGPSYPPNSPPPF